MKKKLLVTGSGGQLGKSLKMISGSFGDYIFHFLNKNQLDISDFNSVKLYIEKYKIDIIINCAAYTNVENSEINRDKADTINDFSVENLANLCFQFNIQLIHISTDFVFDGKKSTPYNELDDTNPINYYGISKLGGESKILKYKLKNSAIFRTSWLYSKFGNNFFTKIIQKLKLNEILYIVNNEFGSPTYAPDLAKAILDIIPQLNNTNTEIYNYSNLGLCSRYEFVLFVKDIIGSRSMVYPISNNKFKLRPQFSPLNTKKIINNFNIEINHWKDSLRDLSHNNFFKL